VSRSIAVTVTLWMSAFVLVLDEIAQRVPDGGVSSNPVAS
jgi:hypothetical protein